MRQHVTLPEPQPKVACVCSFFGYDPVEDKYKVLRFAGCNQDPLVFTLGPQESWRVTQNTPKHDPRCTWQVLISKCINGNLYYEASIPFGVNDSFEVEKVLMSFDVRYEKFNTIKKPADDLLSEFFLDYEGKLAWVCADVSCIRFWVLEDEEKQEWSLRKFLLPIPKFPLRDTIWEVSWELRGITHDTGEFIFTDETTSEAIYVLYYDPKRNRVRRVKYEGIGGEEFWKLMIITM